MIVVGAVAIYCSISLFLANVGQTNAPAPIRVAHWSGYMVASDIQNRSAVVSSVSASWTVSAVKASENDTLSSAWVGIGGYGEKTLIQTGTEQQCTNGQVTYFVWYELLPDYLVRIRNMHIRPGDTITASINLINENTKTWSIEINDVTRGERFEKALFYNSSRLSAEWIVERPTVNGTISTLADFGNVTFSECKATIGGKTGAISNFSYAQLVMYTPQNVQLVTVSPINGDGSSFTVNYLRSPNADVQSNNLNVHSAAVLPSELFAATFSWHVRGKTASKRD
jgi:hypothetical protein